MKKNILILNIGTEIGGIEKCLINFLKYLENKDCDVDIAFWKPNGPLYNEIPNSINILPNLGPGCFREVISAKNKVKLLKYAEFKLCGKFGCAWKSLPSIKKKYDIAISYCQNGYSPYYLIDKVRADKKYLWYHELNYVGDKKKKLFDEKYFSKYSKIICVSEACKQNLIKEFPSLCEKFITLYNLYDVENIKSRAYESSNPFTCINKKVILTVGRLSSEKGVSLAINACKELSKRNKNFIWYWVGDGPEKDNANKKINELNLSEYFKLLGNQINPYQYIKNCDVYVQPSLSEAYCTTIVEAMVLNKAIVATNVESVYEQFKQTENSLIVEKNAKDLSNAIEKILLINNFNCHYDMVTLNNYNLYDNLFFYGLESEKNEHISK